jgi:hypothetical protein
VKFERDGDWLISTPIYAGWGGPQIEASKKCSHPAYRTETSTENPPGLVDDRPIVESLLERCVSCIAVRAKYRLGRSLDSRGKGEVPKA